MKNKFFLVILLVVLFSSNVHASSTFEVKIKNKNYKVDKVNVLLNNKDFKSSFRPYIFKGRTFVPIREITESLGAEVSWNNELQSATIRLEEKELKMKVGSRIVYENGKKVELDKNSIPVFAEYKEPNNDLKTMVPLRFLSEALSYKVDWDSEKKIVKIFNDEFDSKSQKSGDLVEYESISIQDKNNDDKKIKTNKKKNNNNDDSFISDNERLQTNKLNKASKDEIFKAASLGLFEDYIEDRTITKKFPVDGKITIVLDAGHGGIDPGAIVEGNLREKDLNLRVVKKLYDLLQDTSYEIIMTRNKDEYIKLIDRAAIANDNNSELFLSVHFNKSDNLEAKGIEVLYASEKNSKIKTVEQKHFANELLKALIKNTNSNSRGIKNRPELAVLNKTKNVAALVELGFMSNKDDYIKITNDEYLDKLAKSLYEGINNYVEKYSQK